MKKKLCSISMALIIAGTTSLTALATIQMGTTIQIGMPIKYTPNGSVLIGDKGFALGYANDVANSSEITKAIIAGGEIYVKTFAGTWVANTTGAVVVAPTVERITYTPNTETTPPVVEPGSGDKREAGNFSTDNADLVVSTAGGGYDSNLSRLNGMIGATYGLTYVPSLTQDGLTSGIAKFVYDKTTKRYGLQISGWRHSYDTNIAENDGLNAILETFYFFSGDKDVAVSLWKWFDSAAINGGANTDDFGFRDTATFTNGFSAIKNGVEVFITEVDGITTIYFEK